MAAHPVFLRRGVERAIQTADRTATEMCIRGTQDTQEGRRVQEKTQQARFEQIVLPHLDAAYNLARWLTRNDQDAEDVVQEACLRAFRFFGGFYGGDSRAWLLTIVRNTCYTWLRHNRAHELTTPFDETIHDVECEGLNPEALLMHQADQQQLRQALEALPVESREVIVLRELEGLSYKEIGVIADIPLGTVMSRLARARKRLQHDLAKRWNGED
jgi:RNA polymerase sigma factor (sigma-70 family)